MNPLTQSKSLNMRLRVFAFSCLTTASIIVREDVPSADLVTINRASTSGSGCPRRAVSCDISTDRTVVTLGFDEFQTYIGRGRNSADREKNCEIHLNLKYPGGYTFAVVDVTYHGFAQLDNGVSGTFTSEYSFQSGNTTTTTSRADLTGGGGFERGQTYTKHDQIPTSRTVKSPCGGNVNMLIRTRINLSSLNDSASGSTSDDDATIAFTQQVHIGWQTCR